MKPEGLERIRKPLRADAWISLLEPTLPPHLREGDVSADAPVLSAPEIFEVLKAAETISLPHHGQDILSYVANEQGRWNAVVWLVKHLVEAFATSPLANSSDHLLCAWKSDTPLDELTRGAVDLQKPHFLRQDDSGREPSTPLEDAIADVRQGKTLGHQVLGMIWRSLGNMAMACAGGEIKPEILEIIACLHHHGFMPTSIYDSKPSTDPTAIQQSPILNLLSSRILTSLSDAAWRAHERQIVEEAKSRGFEHARLGPEISGSSYRVRVAGLKPEVWLELILWSCLHGGWTNSGIQVLVKMHHKPTPQQWRPLSWRSLVSNQPTETREWEKVEYLFNNWTASSMDFEEAMAPVSVSRTISSEIVNAYIDASIGITRAYRSQHGRRVDDTIKFLHSMYDFLGRSSLGLGAGSWDAVILRLFDLRDTSAYNPAVFDNVIRLSPTMGQEITASNVRNLPDYVFDGTAAVFGLFHRALYYRIKDADVEGALRLFASLQERADENKRRSVADFLQKQELFGRGSEQGQTSQFTDNFARIDYPAFYVQIPPNILGPFVELITDAKAYDFGKWLLYSDEIDGPIIPEHIYGDPSITPALVRFAAETSDKALLSKLIKIRASSATDDEPALPRKVLQSFAESQINLKRWSAVAKILQHMRDTFGLSWNISTLCHLMRVSLLQVRSAEAGDGEAKQHVNRARGLFRNLVGGAYGRLRDRPDYVQEQVDNLLIVLATVDRELVDLSLMKSQSLSGYRVFNLPSKAFNLILEGVVNAYGSAAGRRLVGIFWNHRVRDCQQTESEADRRATEPPYSSFGRTLPEHIRKQRTEIRIPGAKGGKIVMFAGLRPDLMTIRIVLKQAVKELMDARAGAEDAEGSASRDILAGSLHEMDQEDVDEISDQKDHQIDLSPSGMIVWAVRCLKRLEMDVGDIEQELRQSLPASKLRLVLAKSPGLLEPPEEQNGHEKSDVDDSPDEESKEKFVPLDKQNR